MKFLKYALLVLFTAGMMSCGGGGGDDEPDVDTTKPTVTITSPKTSTVAKAGGNLDIEFKATDNVGLKSFKVIIAYSGPKSTKTVTAFKFDSDADKDASGNALPSISGTNPEPVSFQVAIVDNAKPGMYKMSVYVTDTSASTSTKDSDIKEVIFEIE